MEVFPERKSNARYRRSRSVHYFEPEDAEMHASARVACGGLTVAMLYQWGMTSPLVCVASVQLVSRGPTNQPMQKEWQEFVNAA
jgi:hypothetical protein